MSIVRQQRAVRNRRIVTPSAPIIVPSLVLRPYEAIAHLARFQFDQYTQPPATIIAGVPVILQGVPQILRLADMSYPTGASLGVDGITVTCTYGGADVSASDTFRIGPNDPALRTVTGGYVAPGSPVPPAIPSEVVEYLAQVTGFNEVTITAPGGVNLDWQLAPNAWEIVGAMAQPSSSVCTALAQVLTFFGGRTAGESIQYIGPAISGGAGSIRVPTTVPVVTT